VDSTNPYNDLHQPVAAPKLQEKESRAPIAMLSPAQCKALLICLKAGSLFRSCGAWIGARISSDQRISGITVADLAREGLLLIETSGKKKTAYLTAKGSWFARTAASSERLP
jgi:hypothetical protein